MRLRQLIGFLAPIAARSATDVSIQTLQCSLSLSLSLSLCVLITAVSHAKPTEPIEMSFGW